MTQLQYCETEKRCECGRVMRPSYNGKLFNCECDKDIWYYFDGDKQIEANWFHSWGCWNCCYGADDDTEGMMELVIQKYKDIDVMPIGFEIRKCPHCNSYFFEEYQQGEDQIAKKEALYIAINYREYFDHEYDFDEEDE